VIINDFVGLPADVVISQKAKLIKATEIIIPDKVPQIATDTGVLQGGYDVKRFQQETLHGQTNRKMETKRNEYVVGTNYPI
jgi:hypothetical protein